MQSRSLMPSLFTGASEGEPFRSLQRQIDRLFSDFTRDTPLTPWRNGNMGIAIDVAETDKALEISAELPGVEEKDININLSGDVLSIKAEKKSSRDDKGKDYHLTERSYGMFERSMVLPFKVDAAKVEAKFEKGILKLTVAKPAEVQNLTHKIPVKSGS